MRESSILHESNPQNDMDIFIGYQHRYEYINDMKLKAIVLKFCAWSCYKVLYLNSHNDVNESDMKIASIFWAKHKEISRLGIKYFVMYRMPNVYKTIKFRGVS